MSETFGLEIYASNKLAYAGRAQKLIIPAVDGEQGFLAHHANVVATIIPGEMRFEDADGNTHVFAVSSGFVEMINNRAKLFCLSVESPEDIDIRRAQEAKDRAEEQLRQKQSIREYHRSQLALARAMTRLKYEDTAGILEEYGFHQYEISNYAKGGRECRHNKGYWQRIDYLGLGLGASSLLDHMRFSNTADMKEYIGNSAFPDKIRQNMESLTEADEMAEFMFLGLRMTEGVSMKEFAEYFGKNMENVYGEVLKKHLEIGMLEQKGDRIYLSRKGIHVSNGVMADFLL